MVTFTTKAETLQTLSNKIHTAKILPQVCMTVGQVRMNPNVSLELLRKSALLGQRLIVRSSAQNEDTKETSNAGKFLSIADVQGKANIQKAVEEVADAMGENLENQIFIQPFLMDVDLCGVAFTADPNTGGNYYILNYDDCTGSTSSVTDGTGENLKTFYHFKESPYSPPEPLDRVIDLCKELENLFQWPALDIEFAFAENELYLLQVRPLVLKKPLANLERQKCSLSLIENKLKSSMQSHPDLCGKGTIYGVMPDWNPAEMIGIRPRALALSLYKTIITDSTWAYQRDNYGYRNLRSFPLMVDFQGFPYIDTRVSFNSFLPKKLPDRLSEKLAEYYLQRLRSHPELHDKIEFEIAFTCYSFDLTERVKGLGQYGFSEEEQICLVNTLRDLTNSVICKDGLWRKDSERIEILKYKHQTIMESSMGTAEKIYWLLEYCKRYGTLPFAGLARAGFIAVEILRSMVAVGILTQEERALYMGGLSTVGKNISRDFAMLSENEFVKRYGHLRPGTYDICSSRYDQKEGCYFNFSNSQVATDEQETFKLSLLQYTSLQRMLEEHQMQSDVLTLFDFIKNAIEGREYAKFIFTHTLSDVLELLAQLGSDYDLTREDISYANIQRIMESYSKAEDFKQVLHDSVREGKSVDQISAALTLPPLLWAEKQVYSFFQPDGSPNFITQKSCTAETVLLPSKETLAGKLVMIRGADPGYDWIFSHAIAGFITAYGGVNSHMAIRAAEFGIPAVIGVGEKQFSRWALAQRLSIDCRNRTVRVV